MLNNNEVTIVGSAANGTVHNAYGGDVGHGGLVVNGFASSNTLSEDINSGDPILTSASGGCSWDVGTGNYTGPCAVDLSRSTITLYTEGVIDKGDYYILLNSPLGVIIGVKNDCESKNGLVKYKWELILTHNKQDLTARLVDKEPDPDVKSLFEGYGAGIACINQGMDCII